MASRREYEMLFQLSAQMNGNFSGTFGKAQQQILAFQKEIQELNKAQGDISAYQKQQQAVESSKKKLEMLQQQYDNIQREIEETGDYSSDLQNKLLAKQQQIDKTSASLERQTQKLDQMGGALREAGVDTENLEKESKRLEAELGDLKKKQEEAAEGAQSFGKSAVDSFEAAGNALAAAGIVAGLKKIYDAYAECVGVAADFEASMSNVEALSGASAGELQQLSEMAKELGATTKFTAKESADAMGYMAMAGWSAEQMLEGMPGVLQLAAAAGEDLATVSDIVTDSMTAFGLTAADTSRYADVLAATAASANTSVSVMGETFKYAAPVAGALGYSIEDVSTAIGLMANAGIKGSNAGTALRNVFNGLLGGVTLTSKAFGECEVSAVQADGTMADFATTIDELRGYFDQMTEAEKVSNAQAIAGQRGYAGLLSILNATEDDYAKLTAAINNSTGAAQHMADVKMDNMTGQLTLLQSAWEAVQTTIGEQYTPTLQKAYGEGAKVLSEVNSFLQAHPGIIKAVTAFVGIAGSVVVAITAINAAIKIFKALNVASLFAGPAGAIALVGVAVAGLVAGFIALNEAAKASADESNRLVTASKAEYDQLQELNAEYESAKELYGENSDQALYLAWRIDDLTDSYEANKKTIHEYVEESKTAREKIDENLSGIRSSFDSIDDEEATTLALVHRLQELASQTDKTVGEQEEMKAIIDELNERVPTLALNYDDVASGVSDWGEAVENTIKAQAALRRYEEAQDQVIDAYNAKIKAEQQLAALTDEHAAAQERYSKAAAEYDHMVHVMSANNPFGSIGVYFSSYRTEWEAAKEDFEELDAEWQQLTATQENAQKVYDECLQYMQDFREETEGGTTSTAILAEAISATTEKVQALTDAYNAAYSAAYDSIKGQYDLWDEAGEVAEKKTEDINKALETQIEHWNTYNTNLAALRERAGDIEGLNEVIASFADGSDESVAAIAGMATASDEDLRAMVKNYQELQKAQSETADAIAEFKTNFTEQMDELQRELAEDIEAMNLSGEAAESGRSTIQGFIDAAEEEMPRVQAAYARLGQAAANAMRHASGGNLTGIQSHGWTSNGYAIGTDYAEAGLALVGEQGPELVMLQGGEKILTAAETRELQEEYIEAMMFLPELYRQLRGYAIGTGYASAGPARVGEQGPEAIIGAQFTIPRIEAEEAIPDPGSRKGDGGYIVTFSPVYNINGDMNAEELEAVLREHDENLKEQLEELLEEIEDDRARCAYR